MSNTTVHGAAQRKLPPPTLSQARATTARQHPHDSPLRSEKITNEHLQRLAIVYVRQWTQHQVLEHLIEPNCVFVEMAGGIMVLKTHVREI